MPAWEYRSDLVKPNGSAFVVLEELGPDGWEAWHIEIRSDGWREIYFKRPADPQMTRGAELAAELLTKMRQQRAGK